MEQMNCKLSLLILFLSFSMLFSCSDERIPKDEDAALEVNQDTLSIPYIYIDCFCKSEETYDPFYCDDSIKEKYHVDISSDSRNLPFYSFSISMDSFTIKDIYFRETAVGSVNSFFEFDQVCRFSPTDSTLVIRILSNPRRKIELQKSDSDKLYQFFHNEIWTYEKNDEENGFSEYWYIKGKKGSQIGEWRRRAFLDSSYYSKIQILLDQLDYSIYDMSENLYKRLEKKKVKTYEGIQKAVYVDSLFKKERKKE